MTVYNIVRENTSIDDILGFSKDSQPNTMSGHYKSSKFKKDAFLATKD